MNDIPLMKIDGEVFTIDDKPVVQVEELSLTKWLALLDNPSYFVQDLFFPTQNHKVEFISNIHKYSERECHNLIRRFLQKSGNYRFDFDGIQCRLNKRPDIFLEFDYRYFNEGTAWEGITWILDLLPFHPQDAIEVLRAYFRAHCQLLSDNRITGLFDALSIIRSRYLVSAGTSETIMDTLCSLNPRDFEVLVAVLYKQLGYDIELTPYSKDDGIDIKCKKHQVYNDELILIQCKRYKKNVGRPEIVQLLGCVQDYKATKGILVSTSHFTKPAITFSQQNPSIQLIGFTELRELLDQKLGPTWIHNIDNLILSPTI